MALKVPGLAGGYKPSAPRASVSHLSGGSALAVPEAKLFAAQNDAQDAQAVFKAGQGIVAAGDEIAKAYGRKIHQDEILFTNKADVEFDKAAASHLLNFSERVTGENAEAEVSLLQENLLKERSRLLQGAPTKDAEAYASYRFDKRELEALTTAKMQGWKVRQEYGLGLAEEKDQTAMARAQRALGPDEVQSALGEIDKNWGSMAATGMVAPGAAQAKAVNAKQDALALYVSARLADPATRPWMIKAWEAGDMVGKFDAQRLTTLSRQVHAAKEDTIRGYESAQRDAKEVLKDRQDAIYFKLYDATLEGRGGRDAVIQAVDSGLIRPDQGRHLLDKLEIKAKPGSFEPDKNTQLDLMTKYADGALEDQDILRAFAEGRINDSEAKSWLEKSRRAESPQVKDSKTKLKNILVTTTKSDMAYDRQIKDYDAATTELDQLLAEGKKPREAAFEVAKRYALKIPVDDAVAGYYAGGQAPETIEDVTAAQVAMVNDFRAGKLDRATVSSLAGTFMQHQELLLERDTRLQKLRDIFGVDAVGQVKKKNEGGR